MEEIIRIDLPITKYKFLTEGLLLKMSISDFGKLLTVIGQQAEPWDKPAAEFYREIRQALTEKAQTLGPVYQCDASYVDVYGIVHRKKVKFNVLDRYGKLCKKLDAAEKRWC